METEGAVFGYVDFRLWEEVDADFFELGLKPWDVAAGALLVTEAGGRISDWEGQATWFESGSVVAGSPSVHSDLVALLR